MNINDEVSYQQQIAQLVADNKKLKQEVLKYKPEITVELDNTTGNIKASISHNNEIINAELSKRDIMHTVDSQIFILSEELVGIFLGLIAEEIRPQMITINEHLSKAKQVNKW